MAIERERVFSAAKRTKGMLLERELFRRASVSDDGGGTGVVSGKPSGVNYDS
jgi:hypothetical protein